MNLRQARHMPILTEDQIRPTLISGAAETQVLADVAEDVRQKAANTEQKGGKTEEDVVQEGAGAAMARK